MRYCLITFFCFFPRSFNGTSVSSLQLYVSIHSAVGPKRTCITTACSEGLSYRQPLNFGYTVTIYIYTVTN